MAVARILFPLALPEPFDYHIPHGWNIVAGSYVRAPIGHTLRIGVVWSVEPESVANGRALKTVAEVFPVVPMSDAMRLFVERVSRYTVSHIGQILSMVLRAKDGLAPSPTQNCYVKTPVHPMRLTPERARVLELATTDIPRSARYLSDQAGVSPSVVKGLVKAGALRQVNIDIDQPFDTPQPKGSGPPLTGEQTRAVKRIEQAIHENQYTAFLLDGVTGSGKTEVYFAAIEAALKNAPDSQILILLPEIALTEAVYERFAERFGTSPAPWHSAMSPVARRRTWREVANGRAKIIAGARSALFLPFQKLSLIVVDESHDTAYKQTDGVRYHARDMAVLRGYCEGAIIVLATATPAIETKVNADQGRYCHLRLKARPGTAQLPDIDIINMREHGPEKGKWISPRLVDSMRQSIDQGEQALLFLNRRGYAPLVICKACGERLNAPDTDTWLAEHRYSQRLICHLTGYSIEKPTHCPKCGEPDSLLGVGPGVERLAEEVRSLFPQARTAIFSSDTVHDGEATRRLVDEIAKGYVDIIIGTQMVAKGHNFPRLTCVGIIDADSGMKGGDFRAGERTFQLLSQVAGRAGRADRPGRAFIQTYQPEDIAMQKLSEGDRDGFMEREVDMRRLTAMPPFGRLAAVILSAPTEVEVDSFARQIAQLAPNGDGIRVFGPATAPIAVIRGRHRRRFLVQSGRDIDLSAYMSQWVNAIKLPARSRLKVDIDPYSFS